MSQKSKESDKHLSNFSSESGFRYYRTDWLRDKDRNDRELAFICAKPTSDDCLPSFDSSLDLIWHTYIQKV